MLKNALIAKRSTRSAARENMIEMLFQQKETIAKERDALATNVDTLSKMARACRGRPAHYPPFSFVFALFFSLLFDRS